MRTHHEHSIGRPVPAELNHVRLLPVHAGDHVESLGCGPGPQDDAVAECSLVDPGQDLPDFRVEVGSRLIARFGCEEHRGDL
jgi:hypothetical protein